MKTCDRCRGWGCLTFAGGDLARAELCRCTAACRTCGGEGAFLAEWKGYSVWRDCPDCGPARRAMERFNQAGLPARFANADIAAFQPRLLNHHAVVDYLGNYPAYFDPRMSKGLLIMGPVGTGKTFLVSAILRRLILEKGIECRFVDFFCLLADLKRAYAAGGSEAELIDPLATVPVLAIDELGKGRDDRAKHEWELNVLDQIISRRYNAELPTIITTNYIPADIRKRGGGAERAREDPLLFTSTVDLERYIFEGTTLEERVGPRIYSRLREMCIPIILYGDDFRSGRLPGDGQ